MTTFTDTATPPSNAQGWFTRSELWLDSKGKGAWIAAMVLGFVFFRPIGLALLFYMIWSKKMFANSCRKRSRHNSLSRHSMSSTGNSAFDTYKDDTLRRLEQEQSDFERFLQRLRDAKDKAEFDDFMEDRAQTASAHDDPIESAKDA